MRRFTLDKYLAEAEKTALLRRNHQIIYITDKGRAYLNNNGIADA